MRTGGIWLAALLLLAVLAVAGYPGAELAALEARLGAAPATPTAPAGSLPWLHVAHPEFGPAFIADPEGRRVILRGSVVAGLVDWGWGLDDPGNVPPGPRFSIDPADYAGRCPLNDDRIRVPPVCANDFAEMARLGFNAVRLGISWNLLEPSPGRINSLYLDRIAQVTRWAGENRIHVILDLHQDAYSRFLPHPVPPPLPGGAPVALHDHDGAPAWAVYTDGLPSEKFAGQRELNLALGDATTSFWLNRGGIQERYLRALAAVARRFRDDSTVAGYNLYNEPWPGFVPPPLFDDLLLMPFYRRAIDALTGARDGLPCPGGLPLAGCGHRDLGTHIRQLIFVEPNHLREQADFDLHLAQPLSSYPNVVFAIHGYTHKFTLDSLLGLPPDRYPPGGYELSYASAELAARSLRAALFVTEFGNEPGLDASVLKSQLAEQERHLVGGTYWPWKENCDTQPSWGIYSGLFGAAADQRCAYDSGRVRAPAAAQNGCLRAQKERFLARPYVAASAGTVLSVHYDPDTAGFQLLANSRTPGEETLIRVPPEVTGAVATSGAAGLSVEHLATGGRLLHVRPAGGRYGVTISAAPHALSGCAQWA